MSKRCPALRGTIAVMAVASLAALPAAAQTSHAGEKGQAKSPATTQQWTPPRTPDGQPDLQGVWISISASPLERPKALQGRPLLTDEEVAELRNSDEGVY